MLYMTVKRLAKTVCGRNVWTTLVCRCNAEFYRNLPKLVSHFVCNVLATTGFETILLNFHRNNQKRRCAAKIMSHRDLYPDVFEDFEIDESDKDWIKTSHPICMENAPMHVVRLTRCKNIVPLQEYRTTGFPPPESATMQYLRWLWDHQRTWYFHCSENDSCLFCTGAKKRRLLLEIVRDATNQWE